MPPNQPASLLQFPNETIDSDNENVVFIKFKT